MAQQLATRLRGFRLLPFLFLGRFLECGHDTLLLSLYSSLAAMLSYMSRLFPVRCPLDMSV
jgi:hypothetical protein